MSRKKGTEECEGENVTVIVGLIKRQKIG